MPNSQNGWPVADRDQQDRSSVHGVTVPNGLLAGDVATVLHHLMDRFHREVEELRDGWCWGWHVKTIEGSSTISNHASGTAVDLNAPRHPVGVRGTFTPAQRTAIRAILADLDGVVRWGGDYVRRADDMHFEINKGSAAVHAVAVKIRAKEQELPVDQATFNKLMTGWARSTAGKDAIADAVLDAKIGDKANPGRTTADVFRDVAKVRGVLVGDIKDTANAKLPAGSPLAQLLASAADVDTIRALLEQAAKS
jgi:hypothetical protein